MLNDDQSTPSVYINDPEPSPPAGKIKVKIISPAAPIAELLADKVLLPSTNGNILILPDRAPIILTLRPGRMTVFQGDEKIDFFVSRGLAEIRRNLCPVLAWAGKEVEAKITNIRKQLARAQQNLSTAETHREKHDISELIEFFNFMLKELGG